MIFELPLKIYDSFTLEEFKNFIEYDEVLKALKEQKRIFVYMPYNSYNVDMRATDRIVGRIDGFLYADNSVSVEFELFEDTPYGGIVKTVLDREDGSIDLQIYPHIIFDSQTHKLTNIFGFTLGTSAII